MNKKTEFRNIDPVSESWLNDVGIFTLKDLEKATTEQAYKKIQNAGHKPTKNLFYALIGAIHDEDWKIIADTMKNKSKLKSNYTK